METLRQTAEQNHMDCLAQAWAAISFHNRFLQYLFLIMQTCF